MEGGKAGERREGVDKVREGRGGKREGRGERKEGDGGGAGNHSARL